MRGGKKPNFWYLIVLMLKPRVGLMTLVSSPLIFSTIVVFPELSSPLRFPEKEKEKESEKTRQSLTSERVEREEKGGNGSIHHEDSHFLLFSLDLPYNAEEAH